VHEISIMSGVIETCQLEALKSRAGRITRISLSVGEKAGVLIDSLRFAFEIAVLDSMAEKAVLDIEVIPFMGECTYCGLKYHSPEGSLICSRCGGFARLISGRELVINSIEVDA